MATCGTCGYEEGVCICAATGAGAKFDSDKPRYDLVDPHAYAALVAALTHGAIKYAPDNWRQVEGWADRYYAALMRHLEAWRMGSSIDEDSNLHPLALALTNLHFLLALSINSNKTNTIQHTNKRANKKKPKKNSKKR